MGFPETFKALADPIRREVLLYLKNGEKTAGELAEKFECSEASMSYHLNKLKKAELVRTRKFKNYIYFELNLSVFQEVMLWFEQFKAGENK